MKTWKDIQVYKTTELPFLWLIYSLICSVVAIGVFLYGLSMPGKNIPYGIKLLVSFFSIILILWVHQGAMLLLNGKSILREISIENNKLICEDALHVKKIFSINEILKIDYDEKKWTLFKSKIGVMFEGGFNIILKNGEFYRVSPNTENIDELKEIILNKMQAVS